MQAGDNQEQEGQNQRLSMLEVFEERNKQANRKSILYRAVIVGRLRNTGNSKSELGDYYDKMFKNMPNNPKASSYQEKVTGIIILFPTLMVHLLETSMDVIKVVLSDMDDMINNPDGLISEAKVLNIARDVNIRLFPFYTYKIMNLVLEYDSSEPSETTETLVNETLVRLLRFGKFLNDNTKTQYKKESIDSIHEQHPDFLPNQNTANFLVKSEALLTPREFLDYHEKPLDVILESDLTWPAPFKLFSY